jgi:hypothetical protein
LNKVQKDGSSQRDHLEAVERTMNRPLAALDGPPLPDICEHIWRWFQELSAGRGSNGFGINPIGYRDIEAWSTLTGTIVRPGEVKTIMILDQTFLRVISAKDTGPFIGKKRVS